MAEPNEARTASRDPDRTSEPSAEITRRDLLKIGALGTLGGWELLSAGRLARAATTAEPGFAPVPLRFDEPADRPAGSTPWPVTVGVPFANGALSSIEGLSISTGDAATPTQFTRALDWRTGAKTISWVHCDFQTTVGGHAKPAATLHGSQANPAQANPAPTSGVTVTDNGTHYTVNTGAISFTCSKTSFNLFDSFAAGDKALLRSSSLYWKDVQGNLYEGKHVVDAVTVEKSGPLRAVLRYDGWYRAAHGAPKLRYSLWLHAFAGLPFVRIYNKLIWTENLTLYVSIDPATSELATKSLFADRAGTAGHISHGWSTGDHVKWAYSHSDLTAKGANQFYDNTSKAGEAVVVLPKVEGPPLDRETTYYVHVKSDTSLTLHRTVADAKSGAAAIKFLDQGIFAHAGVTYGGRHYLQAQQPLLAEWGMKFDLAAPATHTAIDVAGVVSPAAYDLKSVKSVTALQAAHGNTSLTPGHGSATNVHNLAGWAEAQFADGAGVAVAVKGLAQQVPKALHIDETSLTIKLWGGVPMSLAEEDRVLPSFKEHGYPKEWLAFSGEANPVGISKTHEVWLWPTQSVAQNRLINDLVQRPVACCPAPEHACATDYVLGIRARSQSPESYDFVEAALEHMLRYLTARDNAHADFDEWNFGDLRLFRDGPVRTWDNGGYNCCDLFWWQWYRTGRRHFLEEGIHNARHMMDVDTIAHSQKVSGGNDTYVRIAGRTHHYATLQWAWPTPYGDLYADHPSYLLLCWLMTGYEVARVVLETKCAERRDANYGDPGNLSGYVAARTSREQYGASQPKFVYYEFTGDERFYQAGRNWLELAMNAQAVSGETNGNGTRLFPNNNFWGFFYEAFLYAYRHSGESSLLTAVAQTVDDYAVSPSSYFDAPNFRCTWPAPSRLGRARSSLVAHVAAYKKFEDKQYLQYPVDRVLRQCRTVQSTGLLPGYDVIEGILAPAFVRDALMLLGTMADAGFPPIDWPGNMPLVASRPIDGPTWVSQLTVWAQKKAATAGKVRLIFKDTNLTPVEAPGRVQAVILDPSGASNTILLSKDVRYPAQVAGTIVTIAAPANLGSGQPVRITTTGKLPVALVADTTYYAHVLKTGSATSLSIHRSYAEGAGGANPLNLDGGKGPLMLVACNTLSEASVTLPPRGAAGAYRIHIQGESQIFRTYASSDTPGLVVELPGLGDLPLDATFGPAEFHFRMRPGHKTLTLSTTKERSHLVQPVAVLDPDRHKLGSFDYDIGHTTTIDIPIPASQAGKILKLAKGLEEYSPRSPLTLPTLRLGGTERYISMSPAQWFSPLASLDKSVVAFWPMQEPEGTRHDATRHSRDLTENHGPIESDPHSPLGSAVQFAPSGNGFLSSSDVAFRARGSFSVWGWVRLDEFETSRYLFVKGGDVHNNPSSCEWAIYALPKPSGRIYFQARVGKKYAFTPGIPLAADGRLHFVLAWHDAVAKKIMLQVDQGAIVSQTLGGTINTGDAPFNVGGSAANGCGWIGTVAAVGYVQKALTAIERNLLYNGGSGLQYPF